MKTNKFRVWDSKMNSFWYGNVREIFGHVPNDIPDEHIHECISANDKNKNPIYEGDIVSFQYRDEGLYHGVVDFDDMYAGYSVQKSLAFFGNMQITFHNSAELTVIGNIFENPELLK